MKKKKKIPDNQITVYQTPDGKINIEVLYANENIWMPQKRMSELFGCRADNIFLHLKNIYKEKKLDESATIEDFSVVHLDNEIQCITGKKDEKNKITESTIEKFAIELLEKEGCQYIFVPSIAPDSDTPTRKIQ